jgi:uncharacterized protein
MNKKIIVIYHRADFDGIFCREIARKFLGETAEYIGWDYGDPVPTPDVVSAEDQLYMLDISIEGLMRHPKLIWIDHHKSAMEKFHHGIPGYRIDGVAACRLTWQWFKASPQAGLFSFGVGRFTEGVEPHNNDCELPLKEAFLDRSVSEPLAVRLAGEYDIWDKRDWRSDTFQFGLRSRELNSFDWVQMLSENDKMSLDDIESLIMVGHQNLLEPDDTCAPATVLGLLEDGTIIQRYQKASDAGTASRSFRIQFEGIEFLTLNTARCNSLTFESLDKTETGHNALMGFYFTGTHWSFSLYHSKHRKDIDLSIIASKYGGGGHRGACGFRCKTLPFQL